MITLTRRQARRLRGVFRRSVLGIGHRGPIPPLVFVAEGAQLRAHHRYAGLAVDHAGPGTPGPRQAIALPLEALADVEGSAESPVVLEAAAPDRTIARWDDRGIPQSREYVVPALDTLGAFPEPPASWTTGPPGLLDALAEATATGADDNTRYALSCLQLRGGGEVAATDGRQLLVSGGFCFPWSGDVLIPRSPVFACKELPRDRPVAIGKTDTHVVLRVGAWTLSLEIQADARFPRLDEVIPDARAAATRLRLDPGDAAFLGRALDRLPGAEESNAPATLDLNGRIAVRARGADRSSLTELILTRSGFTGPAVRLTTNRELLGRAVRLGFGAIEIVDAEAPLVCRDRHRVYCWQPLSHESALEPTDDVTRIESTPPTPGPARIQAGIPKARSPMSERTPPTDPPAGGHATDGTGPAGGTPVSGLAALIQEAEALHEALGAARARAGRLVAALRRHRKQARLMSSTIAALKQLRLQEVAE